MKRIQQNQFPVNNDSRQEPSSGAKLGISKRLWGTLAGVSLALSATNAYSMQDQGDRGMIPSEEFEQMISVTYCGDMAARVAATMDGGFAATLEGKGEAGADVYGNGGTVSINPTLAFNTKGSSSASGGLGLRVCVDLMKLAKYLQTQTDTTEAEQVLVEVMSNFDPKEVSRIMMEVAAITGLEPGRMLRLLGNMPGTAKSFGTAVHSGDPVDVLKSLEQLKALAMDLPMPQPVRDQLTDMEQALTKYLQSSANIITRMGELCSQDLGTDLEPALDEICGIYAQLDSAEELKNAVMSLPGAVDEVVGVKDAVETYAAETKRQYQTIWNGVSSVKSLVTHPEYGLVKIRQGVVNIGRIVTRVESYVAEAKLQLQTIWEGVFNVARVLDKVKGFLGL